MKCSEYSWLDVIFKMSVMMEHMYGIFSNISQILEVELIKVRTVIVGLLILYRGWDAFDEQNICRRVTSWQY